MRVQVALEVGGRVFEAVATTLGAGGLFVAGEVDVSVGTPLVAGFQLPGEPERLRMAGRVAWCADAQGPPGLGLEFTDPDARSRLAAALEVWASVHEDPAEAEPSRLGGAGQRRPAD